MSDDGETTLELKGLDKLIRALKAKTPTIRVGVLGGKASREENEVGDKAEASLNNAEIGAMHEFGTSKTPQRSFLRVPIADNLQREMEKAGALDEDVMTEVIKSGSLIGWCKKIAVLAEGIVAGAFGSGGYGKWQPSDMSHKKNHQTLVETQQLRNSITSEVKE